MNQKIATVSQLELLRSGGCFELAADLDLEGRIWEPLDFKGTLDGCGHTIANARIEKNTGAVGFFGVNTGTIGRLKLENIVIEADCENADVGVLVGENRGDIYTVEVTGSAMRLNCAAGENHIGTVVGCNKYLLRNCCVEADIRVTTNGGSAWVGGLAGRSEGGLLETSENKGDIFLDGENIHPALYVGKVKNTKLMALKFSAAMNLHNGQLYSQPVAQEGERVIFDGCIWRDNRNSDRLLTKENLEIRTICERQMYKMGTHPWSPDRYMEYVCSCGGTTHNQTFEPGTTYYGVPYTHKHRSYEQFLSCFRPDGTLQPWLKSCGWDAFDLHMGMDCSGAIYWAWSRVSPDLVYRWTGNMLPFNREGVIPVGDYDWDIDENTREIKKRSGHDKIAEAIARMHKGDVFLRVVVSGHVRMCASNPVIYRAPDGSVDFMSSYVYTHEQGDGLYPKNRHLHSSWLIDHFYKLNELIADDYIPVTTPVLLGDTIPEATVSYVGENKINSGKVCSNYRITSTTVTVLDGEKQIWEHTLYTSHHSWAQQGSDRMPRTTVKEVDLDEYNLYWGSCPVQSGKEYRYKVTALLSNGQTYGVTEFSFKGE